MSTDAKSSLAGDFSSRDQRPAASPVWWQALILAALLGWLYRSILFSLVNQWRIDPNFAHGFFVLPFSLFVLWRARFRLRVLTVMPSSWGFVGIVFALALLIVGNLGAEVFLSRLSLVVMIAGLVVAFYGWSHLKASLFPLALLVLIIPIPAIIFNPLTLPLQNFASRLAAGALPVLGVPVFREGNIINLPSMSLEVAQACSGIRSLLSLISLATIYGYFVKGPMWMRALLILTAVPIAITVNSLRIIGAGLIVQYWDPSKAKGFFHEFSGWVLFLVCVQMLVLVHRGLVLQQARARLRHV